MPAGAAETLVLDLEAQGGRVERARTRITEVLNDTGLSAAAHALSRARFDAASTQAFHLANALAVEAPSDLRTAIEAEVSDLGEFRADLLDIASRLNPTLGVRFVRDHFGEG